MVLSRGATVVLASLGLLRAAISAEPELGHLYPVAGAQGSVVTVTAAGKFEPWPPQVWIDAPGITFKPAATKGSFDVQVAPDAVPGPHLVRFFNDEGASSPRFFVVSREPDLRDTEPNDHFRSAQTVPALPATISGRLDKAGDVDCFAVTLAARQTLVASLEAQVFASNVDGLLRIVDTNGTQLAFNHDSSTADPFLTWKAPRDGTYVVQVMGFAYPASSDVKFTGGEGCIYRLHLNAGPSLRCTIPLAVQRGKATALELVGWNLRSLAVEFDGTQLKPQAVTADLPFVDSSANHELVISDVPEATEQEPNNTADQAQRLDVPGAVTGRIEYAGDEDRFAFTAIKQRSYELKLTAARIGSPLDAWLKIEDNNRKELARNDDVAGSRDPQLVWTAPADGVFTVAVGDLTHRGGAELVYRLVIAEAKPSVTGATANHAVKLQPGKSSEVKVTVKRANGFKPKLDLGAKNLPAGVSAANVAVPEKDGEVTLKVTAKAEAAAANQVIKLVLREAETAAEYPVRYMMSATSEDNGVPQGFADLVIDSTDQLWLTVLPAPAAVEPPKVP